jgi:hypothetical protein
MALAGLTKVTNSGIKSDISFNSTGIKVTGVVTATQFIGDGSGLTGVTASGVGIIIKDDNTLVGVAGSINFGSNVSVSPVSAGIVTVTGTNTTYTQASVASGSNVNLRLSGSDSTTDDILLTAGSNVTFSSVSAGGFTINAAGGGSGSYSINAGISTSVIGGIASVTQLNVSGISTLGNTVVGGATTQLIVTGNARITGILTIGTSSLTLDGSNNQIVVGTAVTIHHTNGLQVGSNTLHATNGLGLNQINATGIITANSFSGSGSNLTGLTGASAGTYGNATTVPQIVVDSNGKISAISNVLISGGGGGGSSGVNIKNAGSVVGFAGTIDFGTGLSVSPLSVGVVTVTASGGGGSGEYASVAGIATYASVAGIATYTSEWILGVNYGSSHYTFTGPGLVDYSWSPTIYLTRGQQYKFTNTMGSHPFRIQSTPNGSTGTQYNSGITNNDVSNGTLTWDVQFDSPDVLYYQCTSHSYMGGKIVILGDRILQGSWSASAGSSQVIDTISTPVKTVEYTVHIENSTGMQAQKDFSNVQWNNFSLF